MHFHVLQSSVLVERFATTLGRFLNQNLDAGQFFLPISILLKSAKAQLQGKVRQDSLRSDDGRAWSGASSGGRLVNCWDCGKVFCSNPSRFAMEDVREVSCMMNHATFWVATSRVRISGVFYHLRSGACGHHYSHPAVLSWLATCQILNKVELGWMKSQDKFQWKFRWLVWIASEVISPTTFPSHEWNHIEIHISYIIYAVKNINRKDLTKIYSFEFEIHQTFSSVFSNIKSPLFIHCFRFPGSSCYFATEAADAALILVLAVTCLGRSFIIFNVRYLEIPKWKKLGDMRLFSDILLHQTCTQFTCICFFNKKWLRFEQKVMIRCVTGRKLKGCESLHKVPSTSSTAQGGGGSFKNRSRIGEIDCCEWRMSEQNHWPTD